VPTNRLLRNGLYDFSNTAKLKSTLKSDDVFLVTYNKNTNTKAPIYLIRSDKWKSTTSFESKAHDWKHIVTRHIAKGNAEKWGIQPAKHADPTTDMFPTSMELKEVAQAIQVTARKGELPTKTDPARIEYSGPELTKYGIDKMRVVRDPNSGEIITAYPLSGKNVKEYKNIG